MPFRFQNNNVALATFEAIEHDWPERRQPVTLCLRYLADSTNRRGDHSGAEQLYKQAISRGEAYLEQQPAHSQVQSDLCWTCVEYYESILDESPDRTAEADAMLALGIRHAELMLRRTPDSVQAADVLAALHFRQALVCCRSGRTDEAIPIFHQAIGEIEAICESVPWNTDYWNSAQWFHRESIQKLHAAHRDDEIDASIKKTSAWLQRISPKVANDAIPRQKVLESKTAFMELLRSIGRDHQADKLMDIGN